MRADPALAQACLRWHLLPALYCHPDWLQLPGSALPAAAGVDADRCLPPRQLRAFSLMLIQQHALGGLPDSRLGQGCSRCLLLGMAQFEQVLRMAGLAALQVQVARQLESVFHNALAAALAPQRPVALMAAFGPPQALLAPLAVEAAKGLNADNIGKRLSRAGAAVLLAGAGHWQPGTAARLRLRLPQHTPAQAQMLLPAATLQDTLAVCLEQLAEPGWI